MRIKHPKDLLFFKNKSLEEKTFLLVTFSGVFMSAIGLVGNLSLSLSAMTLVIPTLNIIIDCVCLVYFFKTRKWRIPSLIVIMYAIFVLFPSLWFSTGGATGSTMPFVVLIGIFVVIAFKGKFRAAILGIVIVMFTTFTLLELYYPGIYTPYPDRESHYIDLAVGMILSYGVSVYLAYQVLKDYEKSKRETEKLVRQLEITSITDGLTGIYNRRFLTSSLDEAMRKAYDSGAALSICIFDIDFFKRVNDTYGHAYGDEVLVRLSACVLESLDSDAIFGRYGGEEFLIIFKNCPLDAAVE
ncbi:MAG: diguanylate cyclase, partial [Ruminococcaceae bacterium]|nr:diguanylate cyclase [Oscillospiraceae bacterium]